MVRTRKISVEPKDREQQVDSLRRGLEILRLFNIRHRTLSVAQIAARLNLSRLTTEKLVNTLVAHQFLRPVGDDCFEPYASCLSLGRSVKHSLAIAQVARPRMYEFSRTHDVHVTLSTRDGTHMLIVEHCTPAGKVALGLTTGARFPIAVSASGRAYLWKQPASKRKQLLEQLENASSIGAYGTLADIYAAFEELNRRGWCHITAPVANQTESIATPLPTHSEYVLAAMTVGCFFSKHEQRERIATALVEMAQEIDLVAADAA